jgi:hypothetical protein
MDARDLQARHLFEALHTNDLEPPAEIRFLHPPRRLLNRHPDPPPLLLLTLESEEDATRRSKENVAPGTWPYEIARVLQGTKTKASPSSNTER